MLSIAAKRKHGYVPLDLGASLEGVDPVGHKVRISRGPARLRLLEEPLPRVAAVGEGTRHPESLREVSANCMALVAVDAPFALLEVDWIGRQVPMNHGVAVRMKVQAFLTDRSRSEHERPEWGVEGQASLIGTSLVVATFNLI